MSRALRMPRSRWAVRLARHVGIVAAGLHALPGGWRARADPLGSDFTKLPFRARIVVAQ
jgi:hypothetical protein